MAKRIIIAFLLIVLAQLASGQEQLSKKQRADLLFERYQYDKCLDIYLDLNKNSSYDFSVVERIADCYRLTNRYEEAERWYAGIVANSKGEALFIDHLYYAEILLRNYKAAAAKAQFSVYYTGLHQPELLKQKLAMCDSAVRWTKQIPAFAVKNELKMNSAYSDWGITYDGTNSFIFASDRTKNTSKKGDDIYDRTGHGWLKLYEIKGETIKELPMNADDSYHIGPIAMNATQDTAYITVTTDASKHQISVDKKAKGQQQRLYTRRLELMVATRRNGRWGSFEAFPYDNASAYSVGHAALSQNGRLIYFTSDMPGGQGKTDIWYCEKKSDGKWGKPVNCGSEVNTADEEAFPGIGGDGALYFSSKGLPGMGGFDIFKATGEKSNWRKVVNLKSPLNSTSDDFGLITKDGITGYFASNRQGGKGDDDIYSFAGQTATSVEYVLAVDGYVYQKSSGEHMDSAMVVLRKKDGSEVTHTISLANHDFFFKLDKEQDYSIEASKKGYFTASTAISTKNLTHSDTLHVKLPLEALAINKTFVLNNIYYDLDKYNIRPDAALELNKLVAIMKDNPKLKIELSSHTDSRASDDYNMILSDRRAKAAVAYLVKKGISAKRMIAKGYGETRLLNKCANGVPCTETEHQLNRRTEVKVLEN